MGVQNLSGQTLGQYQLRDLLGAGGMGAVYLAFQTTLERLVAIKVLNVNLVADPDYIARFNREAKTSAQLEHPHIVPVYDYGTHEGISYVVMRYLTGGSLAERLTYSLQSGRDLPSLEETATIIRQLASALDYAHTRGIIHRDVKTNNVMFNDQGTAFLVDFGIAKITSATSALTGTNMTMGTPSYMAPEQWRGDPAAPAVDQYALGIVTYATLTGRMPFEAETPFALMHKHVNEEPTPLSVFRSDLPDGVRPVLLKALAKDPAQRYPTVSAYAEAFSQAIKGTPSESTRFFVTPLPRKNITLPRTPTPRSNLPDAPTTVEPRQESGKALQAMPPVVIADSKTEGLPPQLQPTPIAVETPAVTRSLTPILLGAVGVIIVLLGVIGFLFLSNQQQEAEANKRSTEIAANESATADSLYATATAIILQATSMAETATALAPIATATATDISTTTPSPTVTPSVTITPTNTLAFREAALATRDAILTATATYWTPTRTPDLEQTFAVELTSLFAQDLTATAAHWTATPTTTPSRTPTPTRTPTQTASATNTPSATSTATPTDTATYTVTRTPSVTPSITPSVDVRAIAQATRGAIMTMTATQWTSTPTPDVEQTLAAELTRLFDQDLTATATRWTKTPTPTATYTPTFTLTLTPTLTPTSTPTFTATLTPTFTLTPSSTATYTRTPRPTSTWTPSLTFTPTQPPVVSCPGARESRLYVGVEGYVLPDDNRSVNVRVQPGTDNTIEVRLAIRERFTVLDGPVCTDGFAWYRISADNDSVDGWIAEGDSTAYFVAPINVVDFLAEYNLQANCRAVAVYDFEDPDAPNTWFKEIADRYTVGVYNGAYNLQVNFLRDAAGDSQGENEPTLWGSLRELQFVDGSVEAVITSSSFGSEPAVRLGLWLRYQDEFNFVAFMLRSDGFYRVARFQAGRYQDILPWMYSPSIVKGDGATNTLRVDMVGEQFDMYVNGIYLDTAYDDTWKQGRIAFWGASQQNPITFALDYFRVCEVESP